MLVVSALRHRADPAALAGKARDVLSLTWDERRWTRRRATTRAGREVALALPTGSVLAPGDILLEEAEWYLAVEAEPEPVLAAAPRGDAEAVALAFEVGNRHFSLALDGDAFLVPDDLAMAQLLSRLRIPWERRLAVYEPIGTQRDASGRVEAHTHG